LNFEPQAQNKPLTGSDLSFKMFCAASDKVDTDDEEVREFKP